jgi:hypothetical protein
LLTAIIITFWTRARQPGLRPGGYGDHPGTIDTSEFSSRDLNPVKVEVSKRPNRLMSAACIPREETLLPLHPFYRTRATAYHLLSRRGGVDVLLSIADAREPLDVRYRGNPEDICLHRVFLSLDPFETIDRAMSPFLKPVKSGRFYVAALEAGRAESSRGSGLLACRRRASDLQQTGIHFCPNMRPQKAWPRNCDSTCDPYARLRAEPFETGRRI